jgi:hypothetical protein
MKKLFFTIAIGLVGMTTNAQTQCYKDSLAWTLQGGLSNYIPFCGNNYDNSITPSNVKLWGNSATDSVYQLCNSTWFSTSADRPTLTTDRFNTNNKAMFFDGDDFLVYKTSGFDFNNQTTHFSFSVWVKPNSSSVNAPKIIIGHNQTDYNNTGTAATYSTRGLLFLDNNKVYASATKYQPNPNHPNNPWVKKNVEIGTINTNWTNYTVTFNAWTNTARFYVNGVIVDSISGPQYVTKYGDLMVGASTSITYNCGYYTNVSYGNGFEGKIDDILFYNRVLTNNEVASIYQTSGNYDLEKVDTMYIHDTITIVNCQYYDTTYVNVYDTIQVPFYYDAPIYVYDTINVYDTIRVDVYDTIYVNVNVYDTIQVTDTLLIDWRTIGLYNNTTIEVFKDIKVYPIPTQKMLTIDIGDMIQSYYYSTIVQLDYYIYNQYGALVMGGQLTQGKTDIDVGNLSSGNYKLVLDDHVWNLPTTKNIVIVN